MIWSDWMQLCCQHGHLSIEFQLIWVVSGNGFAYVWKLLDNSITGIWSAKQVDQKDVLLGYIVLLQHLDCLAHLVTAPHDGVEQQHLEDEGLMNE